MNRSVPLISACSSGRAATELSGNVVGGFLQGDRIASGPFLIEAAGRPDQGDDQRNMAVVVEDRGGEGADAGNRLADSPRQAVFAHLLQGRLQPLPVAALAAAGMRP